MDCWKTVRLYAACWRSCLKLARNNNVLQRFPETAPPESVWIYVDSQFIMKPWENSFLHADKDGFTKMDWTLLMKEIVAINVANHSIHDLAFSYGLAAKMIAKNGGCFSGKFFVETRSVHNVWNDAITSYEQRTDRNVKRYNRAIVHVLWHYLSHNPCNWDQYMCAVMYKYSYQHHTPMAIAPLFFVLSSPQVPWPLNWRQNQSLSKGRQRIPGSSGLSRPAMM